LLCPLRTQTDFEDSKNDPNSGNVGEQQQEPPSQAGRSPSIVLTTETNLIILQKQLKELVKGNFEFRNTKNGSRIVTKEMADLSAIISYFDDQKMSYFIFYLKSQKPIKAVIRHPLHNSPAENIYEGLESLDFDVMSVKQMSTNRRSSVDETTAFNLPLFLITFKSQ
jgi:hypothetical protein